MQSSDLQKSFAARNYDVSRIDQLANELKKKKEEEDEALLDDPQQVDDFIEEDLEEEQVEEFGRVKKNGKTHKMIIPTITRETNAVNVEMSEEVRKRDLETKTLMDLALQTTSVPEKQFKKMNFEGNFSKANNAQILAPRMSNFPTNETSTSWFADTHYAKRMVKFVPESLSVKKDVQFFLVDASEGIEDHATVYLFGKTKAENKWVNICVQIPNQMRELYVLPRNENSFEEIVAELSVHLGKYKRNNEVSFTQVKRSYCFEFEVEKRNEMIDVVLVSFPFKLTIPNSLPTEGKHYKGILGHSYSALDLFLLRNKIYGPGWLRVTDFEVVLQTQGFSDQLLQLRITNEQRHLQPINELLEVPPMNLAIFQMKKDETNENNVQAVQISLLHNFKLTDCSYDCADHVLMHVKSFGITGEQKSDALKKYTNLVFENEFVLLKEVMRVWSKLDPDIILSHEMYSGVFDVLFAKLAKHSFEGFHLGARLLAEPKKFKNAGGRNVQKRARTIFAGRLLVDTFMLSREFIKLDEYSINSILSHIRGNQVAIPTKADAELRGNTDFLLEIIQKQQFLPLTLQLSKVAGCLWSVSLRQARAERNEMLLMHKFYERDFLIPDRHGNERDETDGKGFAGGKVLDPVTGFYDTYIVLVDFNSLYPSIIRHYNICFTTVVRDFKPWNRIIETVNEKEEVQENELKNEEEHGILIKPMNDIVVLPNQVPVLPTILSMLVKERKKVKNELKRADTEEKRVQLESKQLAFKLIANSIYGCLGFTFSRFYCKKMASLITHFGRHLLVSSEALIRGLNYEVIYGDTDSLMINTLANNPIEAIETGLRIKKEVNEQFKKNKDQGEQILEVELDGVFKKLLLLKKKKYAGLKLVNFMEIAKSIQDVKEVYKLEIKGLDVIRRDWSKLTRDVSNVVLNLLMKSGDLERVYSYLEEVNASIDDFHAKEIEQAEKHKLKLARTCKTYKNKVEKIVETEMEFEQPEINGIEHQTAQVEELHAPVLRVGDFIIKKQLNKKPKDYGDTDQLPHVRVAKWLMAEKGKTDEQLVHHYIPYLIVAKGNSLGEQAMAVDEYDYQVDEKKELYYPVDIDYYKNSQVINPIQRLLEPIEGHIENKLKIIFNFNNPEEERALNQDGFMTIAERVFQVSNRIPFFYRNVALDFNEYQLGCSFCKEKCHAFSIKCSIDDKSEFTVGQFRSRVCKMLKLLVDAYYANLKKCSNCNFRTNQVSVREFNCAFHENKKMKLVLPSKVTSGKICQFESLCLDFTKDNSHYQDVVKSVFADFALRNKYEGDNLLNIFGEPYVVHSTEATVVGRTVKLL